MKPSAKYAPRSPDAIDRLVAEYPFALVISANDGMPMATPLPLLLEHNDDGTASLIGHFARNNPQVDVLRREPRALAVFLGSHGYISPSWLADRTQAPTWNYETAHVQIDVTFDDSAGAIDDALARLVSNMERDRPHAWSPAEMGPRLALLSRGVIAFRASVTAVQANFKLGQDERDDVREDILAGLALNGQHALLEAMARENAANDHPTKVGAPAERA